MKKVQLVIFIIIFFLILVIADFSCYFKNFIINYSFIEQEIQHKDSFKDYVQNYLDKPKLSFNEYVSRYSDYDLVASYSSSWRKPAIYDISESTKPIFLFGCSFAYGDYLSDEATFHYLLSNIMKRNVYNFSLPGGSPKEFLYLLQNNDFSSISKSPEYVIFIYFNDHKRRLVTNDLLFPTPIYQFKGNSLKFKNTNFLEKTYLYEKILNFKYYFFRDDDKLNELLNNYFRASYSVIKDIFGENTKFVIFVYLEDGSEHWSELESEGIRIIKTNDLVNLDLTSEEYIIYPGNFHPNKKVWQIFTPKFSEKIGLI